MLHRMFVWVLCGNNQEIALGSALLIGRTFFILRAPEKENQIMKQKLGLLLVLTALMCALSFTACGGGNSGGGGGETDKASGLKFKLLSDGTGYEVSDYLSFPKKLEIPATYKELPVTRIGDNAFNSCDRLKSITIPDSIISIGMGAFICCERLESITIPNSIISIGESAFWTCRNLEIIIIPDSVTSIGKYAFHNTAWYDNQSDGFVYVGKVLYAYKGNHENIPSDLNIRQDTVGIAGGAFEGCYNLKNIAIPDSVISIGGGAFAHCGYLTVIVNSENTAFKMIDGALLNKAATTLICYLPQKYGACAIPDGVISIGDYAFCNYNCNNLTNITIPNSVINIGDYAFADCGYLESIAIPNSVISIGKHAFEFCRYLTNITIPNSVISLGTLAFQGWKDTQTIYIQGKSNQAAADKAWKEPWRYRCDANIVYNA